jgi:hypothetical protein
MLRTNPIFCFFLSLFFYFSSTFRSELVAQEVVENLMHLELISDEIDNSPFIFKGTPKVHNTPQYLLLTMDDSVSKLKFALKIPRQALDKLKANQQMVKVSPFHPQFFSEIRLWNEEHHHDHSFTAQRNQQKTSLVLSSYDPINKMIVGEFNFVLDSKDHHHTEIHLKNGVFNIYWE